MNDKNFIDKLDKMTLKHLERKKFWREIQFFFPFKFKKHTSTDVLLHTKARLVKYYNDLLGRQSFERGRDEVKNLVTFFEYTSLSTNRIKIFRRFLEESSKLFIEVLQ